MEDASCPLCGSSALLLHTREAREFLRCTTCALVFVPSRFHLSPDEARNVYEQHENDPKDPRYRAFLSRLCDPLSARLRPGARGLDFGCGPGPALSAMFRARGFACADYDPIFADDRSLLERRYDFVASSEVFEHLADPAGVLHLVMSLLRPGGVVGVMTKRITTLDAFATWHYIRDPTHVAFYADETFAWIAERYRMKVTFESADVVVLG